MITKLTRAALALVLALLLALAVPSSAAPLARSFLPAVLTQPGAPTWVTLTQSDTTFVDAAVDPASGRVYVSYIDRGNGNRAHLTELIGNTLHELHDPVQTPASAAPAFTPDSPKDADSAVLVVNGAVWWFVSSRDPDDPTGDFRLKLLRFLPKAQP
jgi:hypothetical protein